MKTTIHQATRATLFPIVMNLRDADRHELEACLPGDTTLIIDRCMAGPAWCVLHSAQPVAAFGYVQRALCVVEGWSFGTDRFTRIAPELTRYIQEDLRRAWLEAGIRVCEVRSIESNETAHRWLYAIGFRHAAKLYNQGAKGEAFNLFTWDLAHDDYA